MNKTTNAVMHSKTIIMTHDDEESDHRLIIDEGDRNNNDTPQWLSSTVKIRSNNPSNITKSAATLKIKTKTQLDECIKTDINNVVSGSMDSQLRKALENGPQKKMPLHCSSSFIPTATTISLSSTPLLAASLSRPPVASPSSSLATLASAAVAASATSSTISINSNVVDLSQRNNTQKKVYDLGSVDPITYNNNRSPSPSNGVLSPIKNNSKAPLRSPSEVYANLLMQLRNAHARINNGSRSLSPLAVVQQVQDQLVQDSSSIGNCNTNGSTCKMTAAARKEKLRLQPSFQCPVCKKRFQRHIAMNAHFQNEHIGSTETEKVCKLCAHGCSDISGIRNHLLTKHSIDLDCPSACLVEGEPELYESSTVMNQTSSSSPASPSSSSSPSQIIQNTEAPEQCYKTKKSNRGKSKNNKSSNVNITNTKTSNNPTSLRESAQTERQLPDTGGHDESSSSSLTSNFSSSSLSGVDGISSSSIQKSSTVILNGNPSILVDNKTSSKYIKQEPNENYLNLHNVEQENYNEAKDLTIKKVPLEKRSSSALKRTPPPQSHYSSGPSDQVLIQTDVESTPMAKKIKTNGNASSGSLLRILANKSEDSKLTDVMEEWVFQFKCQHCSILFPNQTLYFLHRGFHSEGLDPWRCNGCGRCCTDMYDFNTHLMSDSHG